MKKKIKFVIEIKLVQLEKKIKRKQFVFEISERNICSFQRKKNKGRKKETKNGRKKKDRWKEKKKQRKYET